MSKEFFYQGRLLLCRHGQAGGNVHGAFLGRRDDALTDLGQSQAEHLAQLLADESIHRLISSPLRRARDTGAVTAALRKLTLEEDDRLMEWDYGKWDGLTFAQARETYPDNYKAWWRDANHHGPVGGESLNQVTERVVSLFNELDLTDGKTYVLFGHGGCLQALLCHIFGIPTRAMWPFRLANGSVTEVQFTKGGPSMTRLSVL